MDLISADRLVLVGPGSEWFWSMAQFVVVAVTLIGIYYQLRIARTANAFAQMTEMEKEWDSERNIRNRLEYLKAIKAGLKPQDVVPAIPGDLVDYWEALGVLVREGHIDQKLFHGVSGSACRWWWAALSSWVEYWRLDSGDSNVAEYFERLAGVMAEIDARTGTASSFDDDRVARDLDKRIQSAARSLRVAEEMRSVVFRPMSDGATLPHQPPAQQETAPAPKG